MIKLVKGEKIFGERGISHNKKNFKNKFLRKNEEEEKRSCLKI